MEKCLLLIFIAVSGVFADSIGPKDKSDMTQTEGERVTLSCSYKSGSSNIMLYWFRQYLNGEPQFLLRKGAGSWSSSEDIPAGFQSTTSQTSTELIINSVTLSDSALYYCVLRVLGLGYYSTVSATDPLTFGKPISLTVKPKDGGSVPPKLSILSPLKFKGEGTGHDICLAAGFFPGEKTMTLIGDDLNPEDQKTDDAPLSHSIKRYYYAGFNNKNIKECKLDAEQTSKGSDTPVEDNPTETISLSCPTNAPGIFAPVFKNTDDPKMNSMTLLVTGLRILLAKCVSINVLMTVKAFIF